VLRGSPNDLDLLPRVSSRFVMPCRAKRLSNPFRDGYSVTPGDPLDFPHLPIL
jgi:hypothetical protein